MAIDNQPVQKKRSRTQSGSAEEELEIDLSLPEPPSKRAKRLARKNNAKPHSGGGGDAVRSSSKDMTSTRPANGSQTNTVKSDDQESTGKKRSDWAIWIGNLEFSVTKENLRAFLSSKGKIAEADITRINLPAPSKQAGVRVDNKRLHRGFAYVDFSTEQSMDKAIALSEQDFAGRKVLIKNAKSFAGRPEVSRSAKDTSSKPGQHPRNKRIWVGNLAYDVDPEDLRKHFSQAGEVEDVSLMTWEDSGRCKGFGFVRFAELEAADAAVRGFVLKTDEQSERQAGEAKDDGEIESATLDTTTSLATKKKARKWFINRLFGRQLDVQFAEDSSSRYKKRFGHELQDDQDE